MKKVVRRSFILGTVAGIVICLVVLCAFLLPKKDYYEGLDESYGKYYEIEQIIEKEALADYKPEGINDDMIRDIVAHLDDPYAQYFTPEEYKAFLKKYAEDFVGVGLHITDSDGRVVVEKVLENGPAMEAGLKEGDVILAIDGRTVKNADEASAGMEGDKGTEVTVTVERDGEKNDYAMIREEITEKSVLYEHYNKEDGIGYICITTFKTGTADEFKRAVKDLKNEGYDKFMIDLRFNGGGTTDEAYKIADYLLPACRMLTEVDKNGNENEQKSDASNAGIKYVLLVGDCTASASEMVAGAIQDNKGGKLIGITTYGKGVTQKTHQFKDGSALKLTIEEFFTPDGNKINGVGIKPDIEYEDVYDNVGIYKRAAEELMK